jgi:hypothetical protein
MIPRVTVRDSHDADVIRKALDFYLGERKRVYHQAAATADVETTLRLSLDYESDKEYVCGLLRAVGDGTMVPQPDIPPDDMTASEEGSNDE